MIVNGPWVPPLEPLLELELPLEEELLDDEPLLEEDDDPLLELLDDVDDEVDEVDDDVELPPLVDELEPSLPLPPHPAIAKQARVITGTSGVRRITPVSEWQWLGDAGVYSRNHPDERNVAIG